MRNLVYLWGAMLALSSFAFAAVYFVAMFTAYAKVRGLLPS